MECFGTAGTPMATSVSGATEEAPLKSIWYCAKMKKTVDPITYKVKTEWLHCGVVALCAATQLVNHAAKKRGGEIRTYLAVHYDHCTKLCNDMFNNVMPVVAARKSYVRQEVN